MSNISRTINNYFDSKVESLKTRLLDAAINLPKDEFNSFVDWMNCEYKNFLSLSRAKCKLSLNKLKVDSPSYLSLIEVLENRIDEYGSMKYFGLTATVLMENIEQTDIFDVND
ncbi:MAG: hypothetical protein QM504_06785 [Pseudomonadota bacterium]